MQDLTEAGQLERDGGTASTEGRPATAAVVNPVDL